MKWNAPLNTVEFIRNSVLATKVIHVVPFTLCYRDEFCMTNKVRLTVSLDPSTRKIINKVSLNHHFSRSNVVNVAVKTLGARNYIAHENNVIRIKSRYIRSNNQLHDNTHMIRLHIDRMSENLNQIARAVNSIAKYKDPAPNFYSWLKKQLSVISSQAKYTKHEVLEMIRHARS